MKKILLFGKNGQVGYELMRTLSILGDIVAIDIDECDLTQPGSIIKTLETNAPEIVINAAAYTAVDKAESEPDIAHKINATAPCVMAGWAEKNHSLMIHYSTDYVFDGTNKTPWKEDDSPNPLNVYGKTKLEGDIAIRESGCKHLIFRTSWVYGSRGANFYLTIKRLLTEREEIRVVNDQVGAPTWCRAISEATAQVLAQILSPACTIKDFSGVYNMTNSGNTSWFGFAEAIKKELEKDPSITKLATIIPIPSGEYRSPARRPLYSRLDCEKLLNTFGVKLPEWRESLFLNF